MRVEMLRNAIIKLAIFWALSIPHTILAIGLDHELCDMVTITKIAIPNFGIRLRCKKQEEKYQDFSCPLVIT
jgi:hypothetical protein